MLNKTWLYPIVFIVFTSLWECQGSEKAIVSYVLEPYDFDNATVSQLDLPDRQYDPTVLQLLIDKGSTSDLALSTTSDAAFGSGALDVVGRQATGNSENQNVLLYWTFEEDEKPANCIGASHISLWYKVPDAQPPIDMSLVLFSDMNCTKNCSRPENLHAFSTSPFPLVQTSADSQWNELVVNLGSDNGFASLSSTVDELTIDRIRGWGLSFNVSKFEQGEPFRVLVDHFACVGDGDLFGAMFRSQGSFESDVEREFWGVSYFKSSVAEERTRMTLAGSALSMDYTVEQTESWGGFNLINYIFPANAYYNLSEATHLTMRYQVQTVASVPNRAHFRVIVNDAFSCMRDCEEEDKNRENFYSFHYILDDLGSGSINILLEGDDKPSSPLWLTGWSGGLQNRVFDREKVKGVSYEVSIDSQGNMSSLVSGAFGFGDLRAVRRPSDELFYRYTNNTEVVYVLEPFELETNATSLEDTQYSPTSVLFSSRESEGLLFNVSITPEALFGSSSLRVEAVKAEAGSVGRGEIRWVDERTPFNCIGASHLSLWYMIPDQQASLVRMSLSLLDDSTCLVNCSDPDLLKSFVTEPVVLSREASEASKNLWQELIVPMDRTLSSFSDLSGNDNMLRLDHLRGWSFNFEVPRVETSVTLLLDHFACVGGGDLVGSVFKIQDSYTEAVADGVWQSIFHESPLSENKPTVQLQNEEFQVEYTLQKTASWGGFMVFHHFVPGNSYYNLSDASVIWVDYKMSNASAVRGLTELRFILADATDCFINCRSENTTELYYSFHPISEEDTQGTIKIELEGGTSPSSTDFWWPGCSGANHNRVFERSKIKGISLELNFASDGDIESTASGFLSVGDLRAKTGVSLESLEEGSGSAVVIEPGLRLSDWDEFQLIFFLGFDSCLQRCLDDSDCLFGFVYNDQACFLGTSYFNGDSIILTPLSHEEADYSTFWVDDLDKRGLFCEVCSCNEAARFIDCRGRGLSIVPKLLGSESWMPRVVDLGENPLLTMIGTGAFQNISTSLEEIVLPESLRFLSPAAFSDLPVLKRVSMSGAYGWSNHSVKNVIVDQSGIFDDVCCNAISHINLTFPETGLAFCDLQVALPGVDSTFLEFTQYANPNVLDILGPTSPFASEGSESPQKCAEYCHVFPDCMYFEYDARHSEAEHKCYLLLDNGTQAERVCCDYDHYADLERTKPGFTAGVSPRARYETFNARVEVSTSSLQADSSNSYTVGYEVRLGSTPSRGAVWITSELDSSTNLEYTVSPRSVALYNNVTTARFTVSVSISDSSRGDTLVFSNRIESCDSAFTTSNNQAGSVYVKVVVRQMNSAVVMVITVITMGVLLVFSALLTLYIWDRRRRLLARLEMLDLNPSDRDEEKEVQKLTRMDDIRIIVGRSVILVTTPTFGIITAVWAKRAFESASRSSPATSHVPTNDESDDSHGRYVVVLSVIFAVQFVLFLAYDWFVRRRNRILVFNAAKANEVVTAMFPEQVREKIMNETRTNKIRQQNKGREDEDEDGVLAELYPNTTLCFADICGFTAWSSSRQPQQVFTLLEHVFGAFDKIARKTKVYKVESVGDGYLAICGAPEPKEDHAEAICQFACKCLKTFTRLTRQLVVTLGPDTGELNLRIGIHTGQVVFGVLRNERARYQLFGDCVNVASRMESTGIPGRIQVSLTTTEQLSSKGLGNWFIKRDNPVETKGKGMLETFWLDPVEVKYNDETTGSSSAESEFSGVSRMHSDVRLIEWSVKSLTTLLKKIMVHRQGAQIPKNISAESFSLKEGTTFFDEVAEIIELPPPNGVDIERTSLRNVEIDSDVISELRELVGRIASLYNENPFHNFEHATHVTMSILKLLSRIVKPSDKEDDEFNNSYGITSDPLTQFACCFSSLIHDLGHPGVFNTQLSQERPDLGERYKNRSVAEQNSLELSLDMFALDDFANLRAALFTTIQDQERFRQLVVNSVMATDIVDKDLKELRNARWNTAFHENKQSRPESARVSQNRKATIVIEHLIQASDVAHTMQHWNVYRKWNQRLFHEMYKAHKSGRSPVNPTANWAKGEIGFFDFYIIPLAKKLKECGVFGVSSDEYLNYALQNRKRWEIEGAAITAQMIENIERSEHEDTTS